MSKCVLCVKFICIERALEDDILASKEKVTGKLKKDFGEFSC